MGFKAVVGGVSTTVVSTSCLQMILWCSVMQMRSNWTSLASLDLVPGLKIIIRICEIIPISKWITLSCLPKFYNRGMGSLHYLPWFTSGASNKDFGVQNLVFRG